MTPKEMEQKLNQAWDLVTEVLAAHKKNNGWDDELGDLLADAAGGIAAITNRLDTSGEKPVLCKNSLKRKKEAVSITPVAPSQPLNMQNYDQKRKELMDKQQKQRKTKDAPGKSFKERLDDQMRMFYD